MTLEIFRITFRNKSLLQQKSEAREQCPLFRPVVAVTISNHTSCLLTGQQEAARRSHVGAC